MARYKVTIHYREPSYEKRSSPKPNPYRWTYEIIGRDDNDATLIAVREFKAVARLSSVSWVRTIIRIECLRLNS